MISRKLKFNPQAIVSATNIWSCNTIQPNMHSSFNVSTVPDREQFIRPHIQIHNRDVIVITCKYTARTEKKIN